MGVSVTGTIRECEVCHTSFRGRADARTCSGRCRQRLHRNGGYVVTAEDRAVIDRVLADDSDLPPRLTPEQVRAHVLVTARRHR